ncbi:MAG TPA: CHAT domain-containing protein [Thermoanaerobaculia bacterium]|nr:CHAT domain-containing protein [Thermoanaerobaculia bacterium]
MRILSAIVVLLCATSVCAQSPEETARRYLTFAYDGAFHALPKTPNAKTEKFELSVRKMLRVRCVRVETIDIVEQTNDAVEVRVTLRKDDADLDVVPLRLKLDGARVSAVEFPDEELADRLLAASGEEQLRILRAHPERITKSLVRTLHARAIAIFNFSRGKTPAEVSKAAMHAAALTREVGILASDRGGEAFALGVESIDAWMQHQDTPRAIRTAREGVAIAETTGDADVLARTWYNLGRALSTDKMRDGLVAEVESCYRTTLGHAERAEDPYVHVRVLSSLAGIVNGRCDHMGARRYADQMLEISYAFGDMAGVMDAESLLTLIYMEQGDRERARYHHQRAFRIAERTHSRMLPGLMVRSARFAAEDGRYDEARALFAKALPRDARGELVWNSNVSRSFIRSALHYMGDMEADLGRIAEAECLMSQSGALPTCLAPHYMKRGDPEMALRVALGVLERAGDDLDAQNMALLAAAQAYRALGWTEQAWDSIREAIELREELSPFIAGGDQQHIHESNARAAHYHLAAALALDRGDPLESLTLLEHARARVLTEILEQGRPGALAEADAADRHEQARREREITKLNVELDRARVTGDPSAATALEAKLADARAAYLSFLDGIRARSGRRVVTHRRPDVRAFAAMIERLPDHVAAVEYLVEDDRLLAFVVRNGNVVHHEVKIERKAIEQRVNAFVDMLSRRNLHVRDAARDVYDVLVRPLERELAGAEMLLVVPDGVLWRVPFAALADARGRYLVERTAFVYAPSITAFLTMAEAKTGTRPASFFGVGNPALSQTARRNFTSFYRDATLDPIPDAEREVDAAWKLYDPRQSRVLKGAQATEVATKSGVRDATIVHFATHALLDDRHPMYSRLALAPDSELSDDGWLESWEIARLELDAEVVILSACETARGAIGGGEGVVGMAWSFFLAGARSTVATQWKIASRSTADLMIAFHRSLRESGNKADALRDAQLALLRDRRYEHPFYWGAFVLIGDPGVSPLSATTSPAVPGPVAARVARRTPPRM